jgi:hypothetical protein
MKCKICDSTAIIYTHKYLSMLVPEGFPLPGELDLNFCRECQFISNSSSAIELNYTEYYTELNKHQIREGNLFEIDEIYFKELIEYISSNSEFSFIGSRILDFGSGALLFSELAKVAGAESAENYDVGMKGIAHTKYDLIVSTHTFEHILDPVQIFQDLLMLLRKDGYIAIAVPDASTYAKAYYGPYSHFDLEHINHFSIPSLTAMFDRFGLEVVAVRSSERRVSPTLAYSEVLLVGRKTQADSTARPEIGTFNAERELQSLFELYDQDFATTLKAFQSAIQDAESKGNSKFAIYGLSSHAFRLLNALNQLNLLSIIDFYGDSDSRLSKYSFQEKPILNKKEFYEEIDKLTKAGSTLVIFVFAINSFRIVEMFEKELPLNSIRLVALPPDSQNRKDFG